MKQAVEFDFALGQNVMIAPIETIGTVVNQVHDMGNKNYGVTYWAEGIKKTTQCMASELIGADTKPTHGKPSDGKPSPGFA